MKEFRPRLTSEMLEFFCEAIDTEVNRLVKIHDEKKALARDMACKLMNETDSVNWDKNPEYQKVCEEAWDARKKVMLLEEIEIQFNRLLKNETKGRRSHVRPWQSRLWHPALRR